MNPDKSRKKKALVLGATSAIARAVIRELASNNYEFHLVARDGNRLEAIQKDLQVRYDLSVTTAMADLSETDSHPQLLVTAKECLGRLDLVFIAYGTLADQEACQRDFSLTEKELYTNFVSVASLVDLLANEMEQQGHGSLAVITSVAGDRGRKSNYVYGSAKGALTIYLQGVRNRLSSVGVHVLTIKPGFVHTPMTAHLEKGLLYASSERVARDIVRAIDKKKQILFTPWYWFWIMLAIKLIPERIFKGTNI